jgi:hypothetical protein
MENAFSGVTGSMPAMNVCVEGAILYGKFSRNNSIIGADNAPSGIGQ